MSRRNDKAAVWRAARRLGMAAAVASALTGQPATAAPAKSARPPNPGKIGVYCRLTDVAGKPEALRQTMEEIKRAGIEFILPW